MSLAQKNLERFILIANSIEIERDLEPLILYLCSTDYFIAPASMGKNHDGIPGGLFHHCQCMYKALVHMNELINNKFSNLTLFIVAFCHDLCKIGIYSPKEKWHKLGKEWVSEPGYLIIDNFPMGHGEKSVYIASKYINLTKLEILAIRWHMGAFEIGAIICPTVKWSFEKAQTVTPLVRLAHIADLMAVTISQSLGEK